jgi:hypothetical protein
VEEEKEKDEGKRKEISERLPKDNFMTRNGTFTALRVASSMAISLNLFSSL